MDFIKWLHKIDNWLINLFHDPLETNASQLPMNQDTPFIAPVTQTPPKPPRVLQWAKAVQQNEGWCIAGGTLNGVYYPLGTPSFQHKNPGNLRLGSFTKGFKYIGVTPNNFLIFANEQDGLDALCQFLTNAATGKYAPRYTPDMFLRDMCKTYGNPPDDGYAKGIASMIGATIQTPIKNLV